MLYIFLFIHLFMQYAMNDIQYTIFNIQLAIKNIQHATGMDAKFDTVWKGKTEKMKFDQRARAMAKVRVK